MSAPIGYDKLGFLVSVSDCKLEPWFEAPLAVPRASTAAGSEAGRGRLLYVDTDGREIYGTRVEPERDKDYQFWIVPDNFNAGPSLVFVQFSAGAFKDSNLEPLSRDAIGDVTLAVQAHLRERGAIVPIEKRGKLFRVDSCRRSVMEAKPTSYFSLLESAGARRTTRKTDYGGLGLNVGAGDWELNIYPKYPQMRAMGYSTNGCHPNTLTDEVRAMSGPQIKAMHGLAEATLSELRANHSNVIRAHRAVVERELFKHREQANRPSPYDVAAMADAAMAAGSRAARDNFERDLGRLALIRELGLAGAINFECEHFALDDTDAAKKKRYRIEDEFKATGQWLAVHKPGKRGEVSRMALYRELQEKLLVAA